eukprot:300226-Chlamydomonas_euryale.AAC.2
MLQTRCDPSTRLAIHSGSHGASSLVGASNPLPPLQKCCATLLFTFDSDKGPPHTHTHLEAVAIHIALRHERAAYVDVLNLLRRDVLTLHLAACANTGVA